MSRFEHRLVFSESGLRRSLGFPLLTFRCWLRLVGFLFVSLLGWQCVATVETQGILGDPGWF